LQYSGVLDKHLFMKKSCSNFRFAAALFTFYRLMKQCEKTDLIVKIGPVFVGSCACVFVAVGRFDYFVVEPIGREVIREFLEVDKFAEFTDSAIQNTVVYRHRFRAVMN
jgi:hypothetical protein